MQTNIYSEKFLNSISLASRLHRNQYRHDEFETPYITHLVGVAFLLSKVTQDEDIMIAGLMHDSLEDVPDYTYEDLLNDCGERVANMVFDVTEEKALPYIERKQKYIDHLRDANIDSLIVSVADKYHNLLSFKSMSEEKKHNGHLVVIKSILDIAKERINTDHPYYELVKVLNEEFEGNNYLKS